MKLTKSGSSIVILAILSSFIYGILVGKYHYFPFKVIKHFQDIAESIKGENKYNFYILREEWKKTDVKSLISINSSEDIAHKRKKVTEIIFKIDESPFSLYPTRIEEDIKDRNYSDLASLKKIDKMELIMDYSINSISYFFHPIKSNNRLIIYHQGHGGNFLLGKNIINSFLEKGFSVLAFDMPLYGMNNKPLVKLDRFGIIQIQIHDNMKFLDKPIRFFIQPVIAGINYLSKEHRFKNISMVGISGGGWTTILTAAIDTRISNSFPVASHYPMFITTPEEYDFESTYPELYKEANYPELYIMGASGTGRKQVQIFNKYDPVCNAGIKYQLYEKIVAETVRKYSKGEFKVILDKTHREHKISNYALNSIFNELESNRN